MPGMGWKAVFYAGYPSPDRPGSSTERLLAIPVWGFLLEDAEPDIFHGNEVISLPIKSTGLIFIDNSLIPAENYWSKEDFLGYLPPGVPLEKFEDYQEIHINGMAANIFKSTQNDIEF
ncbi:hypothetical protein Cri9333_0549 [Crinalium epipsammum PCC 9333]|uniref:Uncharacterized protein n=2 Tax=Crinalium TaxID=241421 RepID=K9VVB0_9CYAN|nr:hypothetical protein Cri9333_0549 [Crinalium epipsammum PCC 9333]